MRGKVTFTSMLDPIRDKSGLWPSVKSGLFIVALFALMINLSCETSADLNPKSNSPPVITSAKILPETPYSQSELNAVVQCQDPDHDPMTLHYQWMRNGEEIAGENKNALTGYNFKKGDSIRVKVTPSDGKGNGEPFLSPPVKILKSPPAIQEVWIEPKAAHVTDRLTVNVKSSDPDGDAIYYTYQWKKNGEVLNEEGSEFLEHGRFKRGDSIAVTVTFDNKESSARPKTSDPVVILNSPPLIFSSPPTSTDGMRYLYQVQAKDPDNDPLLFTLNSGPKGMEIDKKTGLIQWEVRKEDKEEHPVEIEVSDGAGAKCIQRYALRVDFR